MIRRIITFLAGLVFTLNVYSQASYTLSGKLVRTDKKTPIEFATISLSDDKSWTMTNERGEFTIIGVERGEILLRASCLGFVEVTRTIVVDRSISGMEIVMQEKNLALNEVVVTAQTKASDMTSSYTIDRATLDHAQLLNVSEITSLLPGGKTSNAISLMSDNQLYLHSQSTENGNPAFGTAIEIDGVRLSNNNVYNPDGSSTKGAGTRNISPINIESVEVITGIPSVEHGDLSNGIVSFTTRKGRTPYIIEMTTKPHTKQVALTKGFSLGEKIGTLNLSLDHTKSISKIYSPYTSYDRNTVSLNYSNVFNKSGNHPIRLSLGLSGNIGGYDSKADPDNFNDSYTKQKDNTLRANFQVKYLANKSWISNIELSGSLARSDKQYESKEYKSSAAATAAIHTREEGYFMGVPYEDDPSSPIVLTRPGYWSIIRYHDSKPIDYALKIKADWMRKFGLFHSKLLFGVDYSRSGNEGRGTYYQDMSVAPTWREYRYDEDPYINNWAVYAEERLSYSLTKQSNIELMAGVRSDITHIKESEYGTVGNLSPRFNLQYKLNRGKDELLRSFSAYAGWGKAVKLPSAEVLYPRTTYSDIRVFATPSNRENYSFAAYHTFPGRAIYNPNLKWQYTIQQEIGMQADIKGMKISLSAYRKKIHDPYMAVNSYTPFTYKYTDTEILEQYPVISANREYIVNQNTGIVSVIDITGEYETQDLPYIERNIYKANKTFTNGSPTERRGLDWIIDFPKIQAINTSFRIDGNYYYYKGVDETLIASKPSSTQLMDDQKTPYQYIGYYIGSSNVSTNYAASSTVSNGRLTKQMNTNFTLTTHIPKIRLIVSLKVEASLYRYSQLLSEYNGKSWGYALDDPTNLVSSNTNIYGQTKTIAVYPLYYSTWENPEERIPFLETFLWAKENDPVLYRNLSHLVEKTNYAYLFNPSKISAYYSANINITKEIGDHISISFYANNFLNSLKKVKNSQNDTSLSLYGTSYIPNFYYGLTLRVKI